MKKMRSIEQLTIFCMFFFSLFCFEIVYLTGVQRSSDDFLMFLKLSPIVVVDFERIAILQSKEYYNRNLLFCSLTGFKNDFLLLFGSDVITNS